jgi:predicted Zn-dependent peptidase
VESDRFKTNFIEIDIITRLESESKASKNALLAKVLKRGSKNYPTMADITRRQNDLYAAKIEAWADKIGEAQALVLSCEMLADKYSFDDTNILEGTIELLGDIFTNPLTENGGFKGEYAETEKTNLISDIQAQINNKNAYVYKKCVETMCEGERFSINNLGSALSVSQTDAKSLYLHYEYIMSHCAVEIFCVGQFEKIKGMVTDKFRALLCDIKRENIEDCDTDVIVKAKFKGEIIEEMEVNQGKLAIGFRMGTSNKNENFADFVLFDALFAHVPNGKLFQNVREKLSLCYYCAARVESAKGITTVLCGIENENKKQTVDEITALLDELKNGVFTDEDIDTARLSVVNSYKEVFDSAATVAHWYLRRLLCGKMKTPEDAIAEITKVSKENITAAANNVTIDTIYFLKGTIAGGDNDGNEESEEE